MSVDVLDDLLDGLAHSRFAARRRHVAPLDRRHIRRGRSKSCSSRYGLVSRSAGTVTGAPGNAGGTYLRPCRDLMGMQIMQAELIDKCLLSDRGRLSGSRLKLVRSRQQ
jgi:hypothetical protein